MKLPKLESIIIGVFFLSVLLWAVSKCTSKRAEQRSTLTAEEKEDRPVVRDTVVLQPAQTHPTQAPLTHVPTNPGEMTQGAAAAAQAYNATPAPSGVPTLPGKTPAATPPAQAVATPAKPAASTAKTKADPSGSVLYVTIDGLKMRKEPGLKGETIAKLKLDEKVYFNGKKSDFTQEISLGYESVTDHWVKVRTQSGKEGWVFGAGVHYFKMKRKGVME